MALLIEGLDSKASGISAGYIASILSKYIRNRFAENLEKRGMEISSIRGVDVENTILYNPGLESRYYMVPALAVILVTIITAVLSGFSIVRERESGTMEQLMVTPAKKIDIILGKSIPYIIVGIIEITAALVLTKFWFGIPFRGNFFIILLATVIYTFSTLGIGVFTSTISRTPHQSLFMTWFILIFFILLSGFFIPIENMPEWVQMLTLINPVRCFMAVVREVFLKGSSFSVLYPEMIRMLVIGGFVYGASILVFRRGER